ncbi:MAG TPA: presqualene diphosphate synthase HpnD [Pseudolabrys sp.]|nr:presqualene diphosphate synthase HpnD [Pseudolabrys sp.]
MTAQLQQAGASRPAAARAGASSFYLAMRILAREQREAMFEIYSFCREVDDIADGDVPGDRLAMLASWRENIEALYSGQVPRGLEKLAKAISGFDLRKEDFLAIIDGVEMDARADFRAPSLDQLDLYCDRVASAVGRLSVRVFGLGESEGKLLAHHLGRALQLTNILRDIDEDAAVGRLYIPREALQLAGIDTDIPQSAVTDPRLGTACAFLAERARGHFTKATEIMASCPRRSVRAPKIMGLVYRQMLEDMIARGWAWPRQPVHLNKTQLIWIALRHAFV